MIKVYQPMGIDPADIVARLTLVSNASYKAHNFDEIVSYLHVHHPRALE